MGSFTTGHLGCRPLGQGLAKILTAPISRVCTVVLSSFEPFICVTLLSPHYTLLPPFYTLKLRLKKMKALA